jgi:hypothetical protein
MGELLLMAAAVAMGVYGIHLIRIGPREDEREERVKGQGRSVPQASRVMPLVAGAWFAALSLYEFPKALMNEARRLRPTAGESLTLTDVW